MFRKRIPNSENTGEEKPAVGLQVLLTEQPDQQPVYSKVIHFHLFQNPDKPWDHCAANLGDTHVSVYPETHVNQPTMVDESTVTDSSDYAPKILNVWRSVIRPMFHCGIALEEKDECQQYACDTVCLPVTEEEFARAQQYTERFKEAATARTVHYSVVHPIGYSCAGFNQELLAEITRDTPQAEFTQPTLPEAIVVWPQKVQERARKVATARQQQRTSPVTGENCALFRPRSRVTQPPGGKNKQLDEQLLNLILLGP